MIETDDLAKKIYVNDITGNNDQRKLDWDALDSQVKKTYKHLADYLLLNYIILSRESDDVSIGTARENHYLRIKNKRIRNNAERQNRRNRNLVKSIISAINDLPLNPYDAIATLKKSIKIQ